MLVYIATIKFLALIGYAVLLLVCLRSRVALALKLHFALYLLGLGTWQLASFLLTITRYPGAALFWYNMQVSSLGLESAIFLPLTRTFLQIRRYPGVSVAAYVACLAIIAVGFLGISFSGVVPGGAGYFIPTFAPAAYAVGLVGFFFWGWGIFALVTGLRREKLPLQRSRIQYVLLGALIVMAGIATNYTPLQAYPVDTVCALVNAVLVAYSVTRYRLVDAGVVLRRSLAIMATAAVGVGGYILLSNAAALLVEPRTPWQLSVSGLAGFTILLVLSILFGWKSLRPMIDRFAGRRIIGYDRVLEQFTQTARSVLDVEKLKAMVVQTATDAVASDRGCLLFSHGSSEDYRVGSIVGSWPAEFAGFTLKPSDHFVRALKDRKFPLWGQELLVDPGLEYLRPFCEPFFRVTGTSVAVPVIQEESVVGILCLGERTSDALYGTEDLRFLSTLANVAASSITVALAYREIERQLSIQTFLFVLSESLVRHAGSEKAIGAAMGVLQDFLRVEECFVLTFNRAGDVEVHATRELSPELAEPLKRVGRALASGKGRRREDPLFAGGLDASDIELPGPAPDLVRSLLYLPLASGGEWVGILALAGRAEAARTQDSSAVSGAFRAILSQGLLALRHVSELRALKERYQSLFESVLDAVITVAEDGRLIDVNPAGRALFGIPASGPGDWNLGRDFLAQPQRFDALRAELAAHGSIRDFELHLRTPQGGARTVLFTGGTDDRSRGEARMIQGILRDVTEQRELQRQLLQAQKMESVGTMAGGIAHDFNNILTAAIGYAKLIREDIEDPDAVRGHLQIVEASMQRAADLTRRLLSFAREGIADRKPLRINDIVQETVQLLRRSLDLSIQIVTDCQPELPAVMGDHGQIHQMLMNLCVNAGDAMPVGGVLTLRTRLKEEPPTREGSTGKGGRSVLVEVNDTGTGIAAADLPKIFDPFFTTKGPGKGTGLGLSIVYGIVQRHGGRVLVSSVPGKGTAFSVLLPATESGVSASASPTETSAPARGHETIMIVDDEVDLRNLIRRTLGERGYTVIEAADGVEVVEKYSSRERPIDLVLIDLVMPRLGGRETYTRLRELDPRIRALFATGYGIDDKTEELLATGALGIIRKPYEVAAVEKEIRRVLDRAQR